MEEIVGLVFRVSKALLLGVVMYFSLRALDFSIGSSLTFALVPAALGSLNILTGPVFTLTGILFIVASGSVLMREVDFKSGADNALQFVQTISSAKKPASSPTEKKSVETRKEH